MFFDAQTEIIAGNMLCERDFYFYLKYLPPILLAIDLFLKPEKKASRG